jgi:RNA polymerase sigma-70 factor (ECF subfamily)
VTDSDRSGAAALVEDLFRRESAHLISALTRLLGPSNLALAEDVVQEALARAMEAWRLAPPRDPKAWILQTAKWRAIDRIRQAQREQRFAASASEPATEMIDSALADTEDAANQLAMMFSICNDRLSPETHVTLILRFLCGLSPAEIARAFLVDIQTIDRRLHRGRARLRELGQLADVRDRAAVFARQPSVLQALYMLFNEGFHGSDPHEPIHPAMCSDAIRLGELLLELEATTHPEIHALVAMFCFHAARLPARLDDEGVFVPLADQDRGRWDGLLIKRGLQHLSASASGEQLTRWHLEAGIAAEHGLAPDLASTNWRRIVALYDQLLAHTASPIVAVNRALAIAQLAGADAGLAALDAVADSPKLTDYHFYWAAIAELELRAGRAATAREHYLRAIALTRSDAERVAYRRKVARLTN